MPRESPKLYRVVRSLVGVEGEYFACALVDTQDPRIIRWKYEGRNLTYHACRGHGALPGNGPYTLLIYASDSLGFSSVSYFMEGDEGEVQCGLSLDSRPRDFNYSGNSRHVEEILERIRKRDKDETFTLGVRRNFSEEELKELSLLFLQLRSEQ